MKMMKMGFPVLIVLMLTACQTAPVAPKHTQLETRQFQTREFDTKNDKMVLKAVLNVLQDDGYVIKNASTDLGFLTGSKEVNIENGGERFGAVFFAGVNARWKKVSILEA